ncbi:MAG TPA: 5-formyltetrahydrofolate cyclo-ligase [Methanocorpusculum sp.]|nr:5-formyltetrahydrofolate cyclo-ligase [Methanocorpusculum sp.]
MDKTELRTLLKERRFAQILAERRKNSSEITSRLIRETERFQVIMVYAAKNPEVETLVYINKMLAAGKTIVVPIIEKETHTLRLSRLTTVSALRPSTFNVPEPIGSEIPIDASAVDCVILPMVGFDRSGNRLGYGAGYYDRFLAANPSLFKIGIAYACQEVGQVPTDSYDIRMDEIITEKDILKF